MVEPMVRLQEVELILKSDAGEINILRGVDLSVSKGESIGVVGPSGSGKTSTIMVIAGLEQVSSGQVFVAGREISTLNEDELAEFRRDHIGIVFQSFHLIPTMTAHENVAVPMELAGRDDAFQLAGEALNEVGLGTRLRHYPGQLSGGEQQRVALARAFAAEPRLLLADEPTGNLDGDTGARVVDLMFGMAERSGTTLMLITHDPAIAQRCDRVVQMVDGRVEEQTPFSQASTA
jgi:putative ABC transport system ATP-binding protein